MSYTLSFNLSRSTMYTCRYPILCKFTIFIEFYRSICNNHVILSVCIHINYFVGHFTILYHTIWRFNKPIFINFGVSSKVKHQANVATFWRFNCTNTSIVRRVRITYIKTSSLPSQTTRAHRAKTPLVRKFRKWVNFIHQL